MQMSITLLSRQNQLAFKVETSDTNSMDEFMIRLALVFGDMDFEERKINIRKEQKATPDLLEKLKDFVDYYQSISPEIGKLYGFVSECIKNKSQYFLFLPKRIESKEEGRQCSAYLESLETGEDYEIIVRQHDELFSDIFENYDCHEFGRSRVNIGEKDKSKRVCRFCGLGEPDVIFKNKSHAISQGLGNTNVILYEECDICNDKFSISIEPDIIGYLSLFRTFYGAKGKKGEKAINGDNLTVKKIENEVRIDVHDGGSSYIDMHGGNKIYLSTDHEVSKQRVYRALCKYFLSTVNKDFLPNFKKTVQWINGELSVDSLPKVSECVTYHSFSLHPKLVTYIRKSDDMSLPFAIGEFYFTCKLLVFIVPFSDKDTNSFLSEQEYQGFWKRFRHYQSVSYWSRVDLSSDVRKKIAFPINLNQKQV